VPHQSVQSADVPVAFAKKAVCEPVPKLVRGEATDARPFTDAPNHSHQRLRAGWLLRILRPAQPFELRNELLDLDCEHVIIGLGLESHPHSAELGRNIRVKGEPVPVPTLPINADALPHQIKIKSTPSERTLA
jgi:hypothetical protein